MLFTFVYACDSDSAMFGLIGVQERGETSPSERSAEHELLHDTMQCMVGTRSQHKRVRHLCVAVSQYIA